MAVGIVSNPNISKAPQIFKVSLKCNKFWWCSSIQKNQQTELRPVKFVDFLATCQPPKFATL